ncbi:MAG: hypothetical protein HOQ41_17505 [Ensifer adhaerens]|nr:hypothetical protein [Ensifer adhaerens]
MRIRLLRLTALSIGGLAVLAGDLPRLDSSGRFAAGFSWISAAHADGADTGGGNGETGTGGSGEGGGSHGTDGGGVGGGGDWGSGDGSGAGPEPGLEPGGTGAGGGGAAVIDRNSHSEPHSSIRDSRDYGPGGSTWHGGSSFLNLFRQTPERRGEGSQPQSSARQKTVHTN